jgi:hypothetical protein
VDWNYPDFFNDAEMLFQTVEQTDEVAFSSTDQEANPRFCRGPNAPATVFFDLFDNGGAGWVNIYNHTVHEHCEYISNLKVRFGKMDVRGVRFWSYPPGDPTFMEWARVRFTFRTYTAASLAVSSQAVVDISAGRAVDVRAPELTLGAELLTATSQGMDVRVGETLDVFARDAARLSTTDFLLKAGEDVELMVQDETSLTTRGLTVDAVAAVNVSATDLEVVASRSLTAAADGAITVSAGVFDLQARRATPLHWLAPHPTPLVSRPRRAEF